MTPSRLQDIFAMGATLLMLRTVSGRTIFGTALGNTSDGNSAAHWVSWDFDTGAQTILKAYPFNFPKDSDGCGDFSTVANGEFSFCTCDSSNRTCDNSNRWGVATIAADTGEVLRTISSKDIHPFTSFTSLRYNNADNSKLRGHLIAVAGKPDARIPDEILYTVIDLSRLPYRVVSDPFYQFPFPDGIAAVGRTRGMDECFVVVEDDKSECYRFAGFDISNGTRITFACGGPYVPLPHPNNMAVSDRGELFAWAYVWGNGTLPGTGATSFVRLDTTSGEVAKMLIPSIDPNIIPHKNAVIVTERDDAHARLHRLYCCLADDGTDGVRVLRVDLDTLKVTLSAQLGGLRPFHFATVTGKAPLADLLV